MAKFKKITDDPYEGLVVTSKRNVWFDGPLPQEPILTRPLVFPIRVSGKIEVIKVPATKHP